jgi:hypothetical protein
LALNREPTYFQTSKLTAASLGARKREMIEREFLFIYSASSFALVLLSASLKIGAL